MRPYYGNHKKESHYSCCYYQCAWSTRLELEIYKSRQRSVFMAVMEKSGRAWNVKTEPVGPQGKVAHRLRYSDHSISDGRQQIVILRARIVFKGLSKHSKHGV